MSSLARVNGVIIFASPRRLFCLTSSPLAGTARETQWTLKEWHHGIDLEDRMILELAGGRVPDRMSVLAVLLDDKRVLLIWIPSSCPDEPAPVSYSVTSTYRKASAAVISDGVLVISDRFGSIYSHSLTSLELDRSKHNDLSTPINKAVTFALAEPIAGRCTTITSLIAGPDRSVYFSDRDGVIVGSKIDSLHDIRCIWSTKNTYLEQILPWHSGGVLALGDLGIFHCRYSQEKLSSEPVILNDQLSSPTGSTVRMCMCMSQQGTVVFASILTITTTKFSRKLDIASLTISEITISDEKISVTEIFTYDIGACLDWESDTLTLRQLSRSKIMRAYDVIPLRGSLGPVSGDSMPLFLDNLGTLFCTGTELVSVYPKTLGNEVLAEWACSDRVVMEHGHRQAKL